MPELVRTSTFAHHDDFSNFGGKRSLLEYQQKQEIIKQMKLGSTWGTTSQNINGLQGGDFMMNSKDSFGPRVAATFDGSSSQSRASEKKMNALETPGLPQGKIPYPGANLADGFQILGLA